MRASILFAAGVTALFAATATAASNNLTVPGTADVWLAGQPNGTNLANPLFVLWTELCTPDSVLVHRGSQAVHQVGEVSVAVLATSHHQLCLLLVVLLIEQLINMEM